MSELARANGWRGFDGQPVNRGTMRNPLCRWAGHMWPIYPIQEWRIVGHYAASLNTYYCERCGQDLLNA